jgi:hypothetical protein
LLNHFNSFMEIEQKAWMSAIRQHSGRQAADQSIHFFLQVLLPAPGGGADLGTSRTGFLLDRTSDHRVVLLSLAGKPRLPARIVRNVPTPRETVG